MAFTTVKATNIAEGAITTAKISATVSLGVKISNVAIANSSYTVLDDTAVSTDGGYIVITGAGFSDGAQVLIDQTPATSVTVVNSTTIRAQVPSANAASYNLYVVNSDGSTGIRVNGLTYSGTPTWVTGSTLDNQAVDVAFTVALNATDAVSYANTSQLPAGTSLLSNGYFYGTVTVETETLYSFTVRATDDENQDGDKTFQVTITVGPPPGALYVWGQQEFGDLGLSQANFTARSSPVQLGSEATWSQTVNKYTHVVALKSDNTFWVWGNNQQGQLGLSDIINRSSPVQLGSSTNWKKITTSRQSSFGIKSDGTLWTWGTCTYGNLGLGQYVVQISSPVQVGTETTWDQIETGYDTCTYAIKTNGTLWSWGENGFGQLGLGDRIHRSSPIQVGTSNDWSLISAYTYRHFLALKTNGTLWACGRNNAGNLGFNDVVYRSSPTQIGTDTNWSKISAGSLISFGIKTDGTLWSWGLGMDGALGLGNEINRSSPTQVGTLTNWKLVYGALARAFAIKNDDTLWAWGANQSGLPLNTGSNTNYSPVQVGTSTGWLNVSSGDRVGIAIKEV